MGNLKESICGKGHGFLFPKCPREVETIVTADLAPYFRDHGGQWREQFDPEGHQWPIDQQEAVVNSDLCIVTSEHERIAKELEKRGIEVIRTRYGEFFQFGGSFRCSYHPLVRED